MERSLYISCFSMFLFFNLSFGQDCIDGVEVELWGECYNIEETTEIHLYNGVIDGEIIPVEIGDLINLSVLDLGNNQLTGEIPPEIGNLINLTYLNLCWNNLTGEIPTEIGNLTNLTHLSLNLNNLTGEIPSVIGNLMYLENLHLNDNQLTGEIPSVIGNLWYFLEVLDLGDNQLTGEIPSEIGNLINLNWLYLNNNQLTGEIPESICNLTLFYIGWNFNISNNQLCPSYPDCLTEDDLIGEQDTSECSEINFCDLDSDGEISVLDVIIVLNCIVDDEGCDYICMDYNEDSNIDVMDIILMINIILDN